MYTFCSWPCVGLSGTVRGEANHGTSSGSSSAAFASALSEAPADSSVDDAPKSEDGVDEYEDDDEWETEEEDGQKEETGDRKDRDSSAATCRGERPRETGASDPLSLERSFRESFASVNGVLSAIAGRTAAGITFVDSARVGTGTTGTNGARDIAVVKREWRSSSSAAGEAVGAEAAMAHSPPASPDPISLPRTEPVGQQAEQPSAPASGGKEGLSEAAFRLPTGGGGEGGAVGGVLGAIGGGRAGEEEQMPAEMSGMLQRYSEMMLRVVQVGATRADINVVFVCAFGVQPLPSR